MSAARRPAPARIRAGCAQRLRVLERDVRREVAVLRLLRALELDRRAGALGRDGGKPCASHARVVRSQSSAATRRRSLRWREPRIIARCAAQFAEVHRDATYGLPRRARHASREPERIDVERPAHAPAGQRRDALRASAEEALHRAAFDRVRQHLPALESRAARQRSPAPARTPRRAIAGPRGGAARLARRARGKRRPLRAAALRQRAAQVRERRKRRRAPLREQRFREALVVVARERARRADAPGNPSARSLRPAGRRARRARPPGTGARPGARSRGNRRCRARCRRPARRPA